MIIIARTCCTITAALFANKIFTTEWHRIARITLTLADTFHVVFGEAGLANVATRTIRSAIEATMARSLALFTPISYLIPISPKRTLLFTGRPVQKG